MGDSVRGKITALSHANFFANSSSILIRQAGMTIDLAVNGRLAVINNGLSDFYNRGAKGRAGEMAELANELRGTTDEKKWGHIAILLTKLHEKVRKEVSKSVGVATIEAFINKGKDLTKAHKHAISEILMRTDMRSLIGTYSLTQIREFLSEPLNLQSEIDSHIAQLTGKYAEYYRRMSLALAYSLATGDVKTANLQKNALTIALLSGTPLAGKVSDVDAEAIAPVIDRLTSLYAIQRTNIDNRAIVANLMKIEEGRAEGNGFELALKLHKELGEKAKKDLFDGSDMLMEKGYLPNVVNPRIESKVVPASEVAAMMKQGWVKHGITGVDRTSGSKGDHYLMVIHKGMRHRLTGTLSLTGMKARGASSVIRDAGEVAAIQQAKRAEIMEMFKPNPTYDPAKVTGTFMVPLNNDSGVVVGYRYQANNATLDTIYKRNNSFNEMLGSNAASIYDKTNTVGSNKAIVNALHEQWTSSKAKTAYNFIMVGPKSTDPEIVQSYALLPEATRKHIESVWGSKGMMVRRDMYNMHFGYRKFGLEEMFHKNPSERHWAEKIFVWIVKDVFFLGDAAALRVAQAQDVWQAMVTEIKDFLVVKTGATLFWNVVSNFTLLYINGVSFADMYRYHRVGLKGALAWNKDTAELRQLLTMRQANYKGTVKDRDHRIAELESAIHRNPVRGMIEAGLMPSIVEDVELDEEQFSYKSEFAESVEKYTKYVPGAVKTVAGWVYMTHDTPLYKLLSQGTQLSDFVARYTLYQHSTKMKNNALTHEEAVLQASDMFVNYDIPSGKGLQFGNDMGFVMFTKYYMRIQRSLQNAVFNHPLRALTLGLSDNYLFGMQTILDSSLLSHFGINVGWGALEYPDAVMQGIPTDLLGKLFR